jgi:hypothetical protein
MSVRVRAVEARLTPSETLILPGQFVMELTTRRQFVMA